MVHSVCITPCFSAGEYSLTWGTSSKATRQVSCPVEGGLVRLSADHSTCTTCADTTSDKNFGEEVKQSANTWQDPQNYCLGYPMFYILQGLWGMHSWIFSTPFLHFQCHTVSKLRAKHGFWGKVSWSLKKGA